MIVSFRDRETERIWLGQASRRLPPWVVRPALRKLRMLNQAVSLREIAVPPGNRLEALTGERRGQYSVRINEQLRLCFRWTDRGPSDVEIVDYHS